MHEPKTLHAQVERMLATSRAERFLAERHYGVFVSMLQRLGIDTDKFASSTGTMRGLEMA